MEALPHCIRESSFQIGGLTMRVYHLDDGRRLLNPEDVAALFEGPLADATPDELARLASDIGGQP
jgi:hypothetical protein